MDSYLAKEPTAARPDEPGRLPETTDKFDRAVWEGTPYVPVSVAYWSKMAFWTVREFGCLSCGYEPLPLFEAPDEVVMADHEKFDLVSRRIFLVRRAVNAGDLRNQITPYDGVQWLLKNAESFPDNFQDTCKKRRMSHEIASDDNKSDKLKSVEDKIDLILDTVQSGVGSNSGQTKVIKSQQKLLLAMASQKFGYDPDNPRSNVATLISQALARIGLNMNETTIRRHLDDAADEFWTSEG